jgi:1-acyl-sn-glycerol-3-phosphate acyltransferase
LAKLIELPRRPADDDPPPVFETVDDWGRDDRLIRALAPLASLRWSVSVSGAENIPARAGALLVTNTRRVSLSQVYVAWALARSTGRPVRFVGRPDVAPIGAFLRRLGALLDDPTEIEGALRHGELVVMGAAPTGHPRHAGPVDHALVGAAVRAGVSVLPVASTSSPMSRNARADVGAAVRARRKRRGPLAEVELAEATQRQLQKMLDEFGGVQTGVTPVDWLAEG